MNPAFPIDTTLIFVAVFAASLIADLFQHRSGAEITVRNAAGWSAFWVGLSLAFYGWIYFRHGAEPASLFITGYVLEKTLSVDNLMVFIAIFKFYHISGGLQHRILYWGILGAIVFRALFVTAGASLLQVAGPWAEVVFGAFLLWASIKMLQGSDDGGEEQDKGAAQQEAWPVRALLWMFSGLAPYFPHLVGDRFFASREEVEPVAKAHGVELAAGVRRYMTPAFVCLLVIEGSDVMFSFDSVPAVIAITKEPLLVYSAMIFAVLGLRSLYFILAALTKYMAHLEKAIIAVLFFIAFKMFYGAAPHVLEAAGLHWTQPFEITATGSLIIVLGTLGLGVLASLIWPAKEEE